MNELKMLIKVETWLRRLSLALLTVLVGIQLFFLQGSLRPYLSYIDRLEGENVSLQLPLYGVKPLNISETLEAAAKPIKPLREGKVLVLRIVSPRSSKQIFLTINGQRAGDFTTGDIKVTVYNGDYLEIDATSYPETAKVIIHVPNAGIAFPEDGMLLDIKSATAAIGKVKFKD